MIIEMMYSVMEVFLRDPVTQITGVMGMFIIILALAQKDDKVTIELLLLANLFWGAHFLLLGVHA